MGEVIRPFCWYQNFVSWGLSVSSPGLYTCIKSWKNCMTSDFNEICLKLGTNGWSGLSVDIKIVSPGGCLPLPWGYIQYQIMKKIVWNQTSKRFVWNLQQMGKVIRPLCWHQNFVPWGLSAVPRDCIHVCSKSWKKCIKSDFKDIFLKLAINEWSDKTFLLTSKLCPMEALWPCPGAIYCTCIKSWKKLYKIRLQRDFLKLATNDWSDKMFLLTSKFRPLTCGYIHSLNHKKMCIRGWKDSF